ncbi:hypothetical protein HOU00_gp390 [Caulobacter phage CcrPW]|uniref:Uncharacterized protein n=1 Tax=Caulobacter phage CcrPW TaxID=2283271 RepID=A0A385ECK1_9CAUD|nr:hypothetical protein HOU00_gp390 [Caulobacter phage CcrPW]AXQ68735.1 hypothetical protein CcrPW_gp196 [Caulobacter phage CcrPW]
MAYEAEDHEDDSVAQPSRRGVPLADADLIAAQPARRRLTGPTLAALESNRESVLIRKEGSPAMRFSLKHADVYQALWKLWAEKRVEGLDDPGVALSDLYARLDELGHAYPKTTVAAMVQGFVRSGLASVVSQFAGFGATRARYYPSAEGIQAFALAAHLGYGAMVQVGRSASAWASRKESEPSNLFQHAALLARVMP